MLENDISEVIDTKLMLDRKAWDYSFIS